jgi:hypothetical protein
VAIRALSTRDDSLAEMDGFRFAQPILRTQEMESKPAFPGNFQIPKALPTQVSNQHKIYCTKPIRDADFY